MLLPLPPVDLERNRELLAARLGWPDGALGACRQVEAQHPGWHVWWTRHPWRRDGHAPSLPAYGAARVEPHCGDQNVYAVTPDALAPLIAEAARQDYW